MDWVDPDAFRLPAALSRHSDPLQLGPSVEGFFSFLFGCSPEAKPTLVRAAGAGAEEWSDGGN